MPIAAQVNGDGTTPSPVYAVYTVTKAGIVITTLSTNAANVKSIEWELNGPGSATIEMATVDTSAVVSVLAHEIQIWREGVCLFWGPVTRVDADAETVTFQCRGLLWYLDRRFFGQADRENLLANADFEVGSLSSWTSSGPTSATGVTTHPLTGTKSAELVESPAGGDSFIYQNVVVTGTGVGTLLTLVGWFYLQDGGFLGGALDNRGLFVELEVASALYGEPSFTIIDTETPRNVWQRHETTIWVPPNLTVTVNVRLYAPGGTIYWDACQLVKMESLSFYDTDQASILRHWVDYAQDNYTFTHGKSDLLISATTATCPLTGVRRDEHQQFADHANIGQAIQGFGELDNGVDVSVEQNGSTRQFHTWYPSKGTDRSATITISESMLADDAFGFRLDGEQASSSVIVLGEGDGPDREEGGATDTSLFGGTTFEAVIAAEPGTPLARLDAKANEWLRALKNPRSLTVTVHEPSANLLGTVVEGDTVDVQIDHGFIVIAADYRVVARRFRPGVEALTFEMNPA